MNEIDIQKTCKILDNIMKYEFPVLKNILKEGRKFGFGVLLATQYLSQFKTRHENYIEHLNTWFIHRVQDLKVKELENVGITKNLNTDTVNQIKNLKKHECFFKTFDVDGEIIRGTPFFELP